jgi:hypothetical protein
LAPAGSDVPRYDGQASRQAADGSKGKSRKKVARVPVNAADDVDLVNEQQGAVSAPATETVSPQDLATLDRENRSLKKMWANHLDAQNRQIRKMLERFEEV